MLRRLWVGLEMLVFTSVPTTPVNLGDDIASHGASEAINRGGNVTVRGWNPDGRKFVLPETGSPHSDSPNPQKLMHYPAPDSRLKVDSEALAPVSAPDERTARPLEGPIVSLTADNVNKSEELLGGQRSDPSYLVLKGEVLSAPPGRADDFGWPRIHAGDTAQQSNEATNQLAAQPAELIDLGSPQQLVLPADQRRPKVALQSAQ